jgi:hypothetical protein
MVHGTWLPRPVNEVAATGSIHNYQANLAILAKSWQPMLPSRARQEAREIAAGGLLLAGRGTEG